MEVDQAPPAASAPIGSSSSPVTSRQDSYYQIDDSKLAKVREQKAWKNDPKYFKSTRLSPSAVMKMLSHANSGVEKGMSSQGGKPVEVMGLLLGRPSTDKDELHTLIVTDVFPLPIEGAETKVLADDQEVINYMIELGESLEITRKERFMGWYHSHPFDVEVFSHCFLSSTDVSTQLQWQRAEDPHGNPWLAIVIDPLRSLAKGKPELQAFRVYPPEYDAPANETPDGAVVLDDNARIERWGSAWNRYYELKIESFCSTLGSQLLNVLSEKFLWMKILGSTPMLERENRERFSERISTLAKKLGTAEITRSSASSSSSLSSSRRDYTPGYSGPEMSSSSSKKVHQKEESNLSKSMKTSCELSIEHCQGQTSQITKNIVFNYNSNNNVTSNTTINNDVTDLTME